MRGKRPFNLRVGRVQIGRDADIPFETEPNLWFLWIYEGGEWDADTLNNHGAYIEDLKKAKLIFCVWHGQHKTNLFLLDKEQLIKRLWRFYG